MKNVLSIVVAFVLIACAVVFIIYEDKDEYIEDNIGVYLNIREKKIIQKYTFSYPTFGEFEEYTNVYVEEADFYDIHDGWPAIPVKTTTYEFSFGTKILDVIYEHSEPKPITLTKKISVGSCSTATGEDPNIYDEDIRFPPNFISYHTGGGLSNGSRKTFLTVRVNPITYRPADYEIDFIEQAKVTITYEQPDNPLLENKDEYDLLIITVSDFKKPLQPLVNHKEKMGLKTKIVTTKSKAILIKNLVKRMSGMEILPYEIEVVTKNGKKILFEINASKIDYKGKPADMVIFRDISRRKLSEKRLNLERKQLLSIFDSIDEIIYVADLNTHEILFANKYCKKTIGGVIIGYPTGIIVGIISIRKFLHQQGSLLLGILGSIIGAVITIVLAEPLNLNSNANLLFGVFFLNVPIFCLIGFFLRS